ncbi:MAG: nucleotide exchange factor GrpE [Planctomycetota bacterium]|jgi:molecular chaperone GrpE
MSKRKSKPRDVAPEPVEVEPAELDVEIEPDEQAVEIPEAAAEVIEQLKAELAEAVEARKRALADFANYQRRAAENEGRALRSGAADVVRSLLGVLDHFDLALGQDAAQITVEQLVGGVKMVHDDLVKVLARHGVKRIQPAEGDEFDPNQHEAMLHQPSDAVEPNHIVSVLQPGYTIGDLVLRPAKVAVAAPADEEE